MKILQPADWPRPRGYSNGIAVSGTTVYLAGIVGWNREEIFEARDLPGQARQAFRNIVTLLKEAGAEPQHLVRLTWYVRDLNEYRASLAEIGGFYREILGRHYPVMALVEVSGLLEPAARLEIEATAVIPNP